VWRALRSLRPGPIRPVGLPQMNLGVGDKHHRLLRKFDATFG
jgi:hypothetical protein